MVRYRFEKNESGKREWNEVYSPRASVKKSNIFIFFLLQKDKLYKNIF